MANPNRLYRSTTDKVIGGVSGGLADYLNIDPVVVRILFVLLFLFGGSGLLVYIILWIVIPADKVGFKVAGDQNTEAVAEEINPAEKSRRTNTSLVAGILLIAFGLLFLASQLIPFYSIVDFWPLLLVLAGVLLIKPEIFNTSKKIESEKANQ